MALGRQDDETLLPASRHGSSPPTIVSSKSLKKQQKIVKRSTVLFIALFIRRFSLSLTDLAQQKANNA